VLELLDLAAPMPLLSLPVADLLANRESVVLELNDRIEERNEIRIVVSSVYSWF
jgi:hypothetical protein